MYITRTSTSTSESKSCDLYCPIGAQTHFILVDNGTNLVFGTEIELRAKIEAAIAEEHQLSDGALPRIGSIHVLRLIRY